MKRFFKKVFVVVVLFVAVYSVVKYTNLKDKAQGALKEWYDTSHEIADYQAVQNIANSYGADPNEMLDDAEGLTDKAFDATTPENMENLAGKALRFLGNAFKFLSNTAQTLATESQNVTITPTVTPEVLEK
jgi:hypothetical protein